MRRKKADNDYSPPDTPKKPVTKPDKLALERAEDLHRRTREIRRLINQHGPLFVRAWQSEDCENVPSAECPFWFVAHANETLLEDDVLAALARQVKVADHLDGTWGDAFAHYLEERGYIMLNSASQGAVFVEGG